MPDVAFVLDLFAALSREASLAALLWHLVALTVLVCLYIGWRPARRDAALGASIPLLSVGVLCMLGGLPLLGALCAVLAAVLALLALRTTRDEPVRGGPTWARAAGAVFVALGWLYPHFLEPASPLGYLVAAPLGVVPGATLAMLVGFALAAGGLGARSWSLTLGASAALYGVAGAFVLGIFSDLALVVGATALVAVTLARPQRVPVAGRREAAQRAGESSLGPV